MCNYIVLFTRCRICFGKAFVLNFCYVTAVTFFVIAVCFVLSSERGVVNTGSLLPCKCVSGFQSDMSRRPYLAARSFCGPNASP